jgi:hypothetical protein
MVKYLNMWKVCAFMIMIQATDCFQFSIYGIHTLKYTTPLQFKRFYSEMQPINRRKSTRIRFFGSLVNPKEIGDDAYFAQVSSTVEHAQVHTASQRPFSRISQRLRKPSGAMSVVPEFSRPERLAPHDVSSLSRALRSGGAALIAVDVSVEDGLIDLAAFVSEQAAAASFPPPCPVFARMRAGPFTPDDARRAADAGAVGLFVPAAAAGGGEATTLREMAEAAAALGLEVIAEVSDESQARAWTSCISFSMPFISALMPS